MRLLRLLLLFLVLVLFVSCGHVTVTPQPHEVGAENTQQPLAERLRGPVVGGHQGNIFGLQFNTLASFEEARVAGADIVEMDVRVSRDGVPVVFHDHTLRTITRCSGDVHTYTVDALKRCAMRYSNSRIPTFEEVLRWSRGRIVINAEFKVTEAIEPTLALVRRYHAYEWVYFQVADREEYMRIRSHDTNVALLRAPHTTRELAHVLTLHDPRTLIVEIRPGLRTPDVLRAIKDAGKLVSENAWRSRSTHELFGATCRELFRAGVDIAISNRPASCVAQRNAREGKGQN